MNVELRGRSVSIPAALANHARQRLHFVLMHHSKFVRRVVVRLGGAGSREGHNDVYCPVQVQMSDALAAAVVDIGPDMYGVINRATDRVGRLVVEHLEQARGESRRVEAIAIATPRRQLHVRFGGARAVGMTSLLPLCALDSPEVASQPL